MEFNKTSQTTKRTVIKINSKDIINCLNLALKEEDKIPENASVSIQVPGGGDWSNCELEIDEYGDCPIIVTYKEEFSK